MHLRLATRQDIPAMADIRCLAFLDSPLTALYAPYRHKYPMSWRALGVNRLYRNFSNSGLWGLVCVSDTADKTLLDEDGKQIADGTVLGFAWWIRSSTPSLEATDPWRHNRDSISYKVEGFLLRLQNLYEKYVCPNPAISQKTLKNIRQMEVGIAEPLNGLVPFWHAAAVAVHPRFQGRGVGRRLMQWGVDTVRKEWDAATPEMRAEKKDVSNALTLIASPVGTLLYERMGFSIVGDGTSGPDLVWLSDDAEVPDCSMVYDPERLWTREPTDEEIKRLDDRAIKGLNGRKWLIWNVEKPESLPTEPMPVVAEDIVISDGQAPLQE